VKKYLSEFGESPTMDNAEPTPSDIAWLAGVIDGEGSIIMNKQKGNAPHFCINVANSCPILLDKVQRIFLQITGELYKVSEKKVYNNSIVKPSKPCYQIGFRKGESILKTLSLILPHLTTKKNRASLLFDFLTVRLSERKNNQYFMAESKPLLNRLCKNWRGVETERETPEMGEATVRP
jgi:hypothetical protein